MNRAPTTLYKRPVQLDPAQHRGHKVAALTDFSVAKEVHAAYLTATEFPQAALDFPIVFVDSGQKDAADRPVMSPVALLGLTHGENLYVDGAKWDARYVPAYLRRYPFSTATLPGGSTHVLVDEAWSGFSTTAGEALFGENDQPTEALKKATDFLERFEHEVGRTRAFCERLGMLGILKEMKAEATLPNGETVRVDGFFTVDEEKLGALPEGTVLELWRNGILMLIQVHLVSVVNIRHLVNRKALRVSGKGLPDTAALRSNRK